MVLSNIGARGESFLQVGDESYPILFTNRAIFKVEQMIGKPVLQITSAISDETLSMGDLVRMLLIGMEAGRRDARNVRRPYSIKDAWAVLDALGFAAVLVAVFDAVAEVLGYSQESDEDDSPPDIESGVELVGPSD